MDEILQFLVYHDFTTAFKPSPEPRGTRGVGGPRACARLAFCVGLCQYNPTRARRPQLFRPDA
ncbi:MAG: hypothetical protein MUC33_11755 [Desulfobacterales bacterium]|nr:hypothetical protein [Desulfobacterales bacterium]